MQKGILIIHNTHTTFLHLVSMSNDTTIPKENLNFIKIYFSLNLISVKKHPLAKLAGAILFKKTELKYFKS